MSEKDRGDLIREHGERIATLDERIDHLRRDIDRLKNQQISAQSDFQALDKQVALLASDLMRIEKKLDELLSRRWAFWQLILGAFVVAILAIIQSLLGKWLERFIR